MKKSFLVIFLCLGLISCQTEDKNIEISGSKSDAISEFKNFTDSKIGFERGGTIELNVSNEKILAAFKGFSDTYELGIEPKYFTKITIDNNKYLRFYNADNTVSTIELIKGKDNEVRTGSTVCTSTSCASGGGCVPDGVYCTKCQPYGPDSPITGDCKRTTTGSDQE